MSNIDLKITQVNKQEFKNLQASQLTLSFKGKSTSDVLINTLRRLALDHVPTYAFPPELMTIDKNTSVFNNDYMRLRLSNTTIPNLVVKPYFLEDKYLDIESFADTDIEKHPDDKSLIELYISGTNNTSDIMAVTTEHAKVFVDGEQVEKFDKNYPDLFVELKPGETFNCRCVATLSNGFYNNLWAAAGCAYFNDISEDEYHLIIESTGQMDEYEILHKSCRIMKEKIKLTAKLIKEQYDPKTFEENNMMRLELVNEDHTLGGIVNDILQNNPNVLFSGLSKPSLLVDVIVILFQTVDKKSPLDCLDETFAYITKLFDNIEDQIEKLGKKYIKYL